LIFDQRSFDAEEWLGSLDPIGWRFGLGRIQALLRELGNPQLQFESIHVVGTNGKSSVTTMTAALIEASGRRVGSYLSPHEERWSERLRLRGNGESPAAFAEAGTEVAAAAEVVQAGLPAGDSITQFEACTATAFVALARARVDFGVIEAGLGGRLDATNVLDSTATVLTSIGLDHTALLGETEGEIAAEKLAVLRPGSALVLGRLSAEVYALARGTAAERGCRVLPPAPVSADLNVAAPYLERNVGVALAASAVALGAIPSDDVVSRAVSSLRLPGRFDVRSGKPPLILDAAHNPDGAVALAEAIKARFADRVIVGCLAVLADKDAEGIVAALAPVLDRAVCTQIPSARLQGVGRPGVESVPARELVRICEAQGVPASGELDPAIALRRVRELASERDGVALITGSHYLLGY